VRLAYGLRNLRDVTRALAQREALAARERWPRERLDAFQRERLGALVEHASTHSAFYRAHYGGPIARHDVRLEALPPVTKAMMMDRLDAFVTDPRLTRAALERHLASVGVRDELFLNEFRVMASSGSSGQKGIYVYDRAAWTALLAGGMRWTAMMGVAPRLPRRRRMAQVAAPDAKHMTSRAAASINVGLFRSLRLSATQPIAALVAALNRHQPEVLTGYPSVVALLAVEQREGRLRIAPAVVCTTSEVRTPEMTARIRDAFGVEPYNTLGLTETGITAVDCAEHQGLHLFEDSCLFEVVDAHGRAVPPGRAGDKVLVTNLDNRTQPFIRFEVTDLVTVTDEPCACGRTFRRITALEGRSDDVLELAAAAGGTVRVHPIHLRSPLAGMPAVVQYQVVHEPDRLAITLALAREAAPEATARDVERTLAAALHALGAAPLPIRVRVVPRIEREGGAGKFKLIKAAAGAPAARGSA
jgi:phenylacetate-coenzyme A ligase PaaK-like adenylate-forming protein